MTSQPAGVAIACTTSRPSSVRASAGTPVDQSCCGSTSSAGRVPRRGHRRGGLAAVRRYELPWPVGTIAPIDGDDGWLLGAGRGFVHLAPDGRHRTITEVSGPGTRMNDGAADPQGRFWGGSLADDHHAGGGAFYRLDRTGHAEQVLDGLTIPNGVGWSPDGRTMYLVDSGPRVVHAFAFDADRGTIADERVLLTVPEDVGAPDGLTVDAAGDLWIAIYGAGQVRRYSPEASCARPWTSRPRRPPAVRSAAPACTRCTSRRRRRTGRTSSGRRSRRRASSTGSRPGRPVLRPPPTARIPRGGPRSPPDRLTPALADGGPPRRPPAR